METQSLSLPLENPVFCGSCKHYYATALADERSANQMIALGHGRCKLKPAYSYVGPDLACSMSPVLWVAK